MIILVPIIIILALYFLSVCFRLTLLHPFATVFYAVRDGYRYFRYKQWRVLKTGKLIAYVALFGKGKTLSVVHFIVGLYNKYNNKRIYDFNRKKWVTQCVSVVSNVDLNIPFVPFTSLAQVVSMAEHNRPIDEKNDTLTVTLVLGDEFSVQMNSRSFKSNIDPLFLNTLLTCRHHHITLVYDAQKFKHVDALLRQVTSYVVSCNKVWRYCVHSYYDPDQLEYATDPTLVKPYKRTGFFVKNKDYAAYDTLACVGNLKKAIDSGDMLTEDEILSLRQTGDNAGVENVVKPSRQLKKMRKRGK